MLISSILLFLITLLFRRIYFNNELLLKQILMTSVKNPRTSELKVNANPIYSSDSLESIEWHDVNLCASGVGREIRPIIDTIKKNQSEFFLDQIDHLIICKNGIEIMRINYENRSKNRSLVLEISGIMKHVIIINILLEFGLSFIIVLLNENRTYLLETIKNIQFA